MKQKKNYELMAEYILPRLEAGGQKFELDRGDIEGVGKVSYLKDNGNKRIFLIDSPISEKSYRTLDNIARGYTPYHGHLQNLDHTSICFKDGKNFFRSASFGDKSGLKGNQYKQALDLSLKHYKDDEIKKMMFLAPSEILQLHRMGDITYFQPDSERLQEALLKYRFKPVHLDYSHIKDNEYVLVNGVLRKKFKPQNQDSKRMYINSLIEQLSDSIMLDRGQLRNSDKPKDLPPKSTQPRLF